MNKIGMVMFAWSSFICAADTELVISCNQELSKMPLLIGILEEDVRSVADILVKDFSFSGQFSVDVGLFKKVPTHKKIKSCFKKGYALVLFITNTDKGLLEWRLYDAISGKMIDGKVYEKQTSIVRVWAHAIADALWPLLTGCNGSFSTKIAFCKEVVSTKGSVLRQIVVADYDGSHQEILVDVPTIVIAPRWNQDKHHPLLFYSEYTNTNVRLMMVDMKKHRKIASNFEGVNMLPSFSPNGKSVIYCISHGDGSCQLYSYEKGVLTQITHNKGNNFAPVFAENGSVVYFCSDFKTGKPQIFAYNIKTGQLDQITSGGYCASPSYCESKQQLIYTRMIDGFMQLFMYDVITQKHIQMTFDGGSKQECCWSPCGTYILYSLNNGKGCRLVIFNTITKEHRFITDSSQKCSYPTWSGLYQEFPLVA